MTALFTKTGEISVDLRDAVERTVMELLSRQILTEMTPEEELAAIGVELAAKHGRDPAELLERYRRKLKEGGASYWAVGASYGLDDFSVTRQRVDVLLFGDCDIQMEADFLRREAARRGIDLHVSATFPDDIRFAGEHRHDAVFVGALRARHLVAEDLGDGLNPHAAYIAHATELLARLRETTSAPILIDNLPEPTVQPRRTCGTRRERTSHPVPVDQCCARRTRGRVSRRLRDRYRGGARRGRVRAADRRRAGRIHPFRLTGMDAAAAGKRKGRRPRDLSGYRAAGSRIGRRSLRPRGGDRGKACRRAGHRDGDRPQEMCHPRPRRHAVAGRAGRDRQSIRLDAGN